MDFPGSFAVRTALNKKFQKFPKWYTLAEFQDKVVFNDILTVFFFF